MPYYLECGFVLLTAALCCILNVAAVTANDSYDMSALDDVEEACVERVCRYASDKAEFLRCVSAHCSKVSANKRWIDNTHYSEGRRSTLDSLERCIRRVCRGGMSLNQCAMTCRRGAKRSVGALSKKWVDPLNYGMGDDKRSATATKRDLYAGDGLDGSPAAAAAGKLCQEICSPVGPSDPQPLLCQIACQQALEEITK